MDVSVLELVFVFIVEEDAILVDVAHHWGDPPRTPQEIQYYVKKPVLYKA